MQGQQQLTDPAFLAIRLFVTASFLGALYAVIRPAILLAAGRQKRDRVRARYALAAWMLVSFVCLLLIRHGVER